MFWHCLSTTLDLLTQYVIGITYKIEKEGEAINAPAIYAVRHESTWETLVLIRHFYQPIFILKKELTKIPFFGALAKKSGAIAVDRENGVRALMDAVKDVSAAIADNYSVVMFPEGTRVPTGTHAEIKRGIALFYKKSNCYVIPVVHYSGRFWPRRGFIKKPGEITVKFLKPIAPGLSQDEFIDQLNNAFYYGIEELNKRNENE
ncbi:MAG: 1-acyl-sn-glycerol-3-phosphate acyltransferase [Alphaproteobacteria bacterium]|nr:1-acyl-sn-glycerol-3-phosphate acyltransferase [Alphaproteobacteria bacterium]